MEFYRRVRTRPPARALAYAAAFFVLLSLVFGLLVALPGLNGLRVTIRDGLRDQIPAETTFEIKDGQFETSLPVGTEFEHDGLAFVFDDRLVGTEFPKSFEDRLGNYVGRDAIFVHYPPGERDVIYFSDLPDVSVNREQMQGWLDQWGAIYVFAGVVLAILLRFILTFLSGLIFAVTAALGALFAARMGRLQMNYSQWLAVSLHALTLPSIIDFAFTSFGLEMSLVYVVVFFMIIYAVLIDERANPVRPTPTQEK
jgi:succinate dehydrogenase hydrophobic anchor subunit